MENELIRLREDDEGFDDWEDYELKGDMTLYHNKPFTGIIYAEYPNCKLGQETYYKDGWQNRMSRSWYPDGQLKEQSNWKKGDQFAVLISWHQNGMIKSVRHSEWGFAIISQEWDEDGNLIKNVSRDENDSLLQKERERHRLTNNQEDSFPI